MRHHSAPSSRRAEPNSAEGSEGRAICEKRQPRDCLDVTIPRLARSIGFGTQYALTLMLLERWEQAISVIQGLLDRRRRDDAFLLHRPVPVAYVHLARAAAGITPNRTTDQHKSDQAKRRRNPSKPRPKRGPQMRNPP